MASQATETGATALQAAAALADAVRATREWQELQRARAAFKAHRGMTDLMARYRRAFGLWRNARERGGAMIGSDAMELAELQEQIQQHPVFLRQHEATNALVSVLRQVNETISAEIGLDFAANAAPQGGGCCG